MIGFGGMKPIKKKFDRDKLVIILSVEKPEIPERISTVAAGRGLVEKPEYHVSLLVGDNSRVFKDAIDGAENSEILLDEIEAVLGELDFEYELTDGYFLHENFYSRERLESLGYTDMPEQTRRTIVQKVDLPDAEKFYSKLSALLDCEFGKIVPHITLFSWSDYPPKMTWGIGVSSEEDFQKYTKEKLSLNISYEDFAKLDIRIGKVLSAERVEGADKLLKIMFDVGEEEPRQILAGIAEFVEEPEDLVGKEMPVLVNLEPRKMRGLWSEGMILATGDEGNIILLHPDEDVSPGSKVR